MYLVYSVNVHIFNVVIKIQFYSILFYSSSTNDFDDVMMASW